MDTIWCTPDILVALDVKEVIVSSLKNKQGSIVELISQVEWVTVAERLGIPAAILFAVLFFIWRVTKAVAPYLRKMFDKHMEFVDVAQENSQRCVEVSEQTTALLSEMCTKQKAITTAIGHSAGAIEELAPEDKKDKVKVHTAAMRSDLGVS